MLRLIPRNHSDLTPLGELPGWISSILRGRGVDTEEKAEQFLHPALTDLHDPFLMQDMDRAVELIHRAISEKKRIMVYGDYDVDGICAVSIMLETLREMGAAVSYRIPDRHSDGYGLNEQAVRQIAEVAQLLITVDCGITNHEAVILAKNLGMQVVVTDHHEPSEDPSPADAALNPLLGSYPFRRLCGAGVALKVCQALQGMNGVIKRMDLAALATVADVVPLTDENRLIVREGIRLMTPSVRPGIQELMAVSAVEPVLHSSDIAFRLAPRLNAAGRLEDASQGVVLLTTKDEVKAKEIARHLEENNRKRQELEKLILDEAIKQIEEKTDFREDRVIIVEGEDWNSGIIGLAAGRICEQYHYPTIVLSLHGENAVGSCRSIPGVNIHAMLTLCKDLFIRFGGHEQAAGLTIPADRIPELRRRLNLIILEHCDDACYIPVKEYDLSVSLQEVTMEMIKGMELLEPYGYGNPAPSFLCSGASVEEMRRVGRDGSHLKISLSQGQIIRDGIAFSMGEIVEDHLEKVDVLFSPQKNEFNQRVSIQLQVQAIRPTAGSSPFPPNEKLFDLLLHEIGLLAAKEMKPSEHSSVLHLPRSIAYRMLKRPRGTLFLTFDKETAQTAASETCAETLVGNVKDGRGFSVVLLCPQTDKLQDVWENIVVADGNLMPGFCETLKEKCPRAVISLVSEHSGMKDLLNHITLDDETLRNVYRACRKAKTVQEVMKLTSMDREQVLTALRGFEETKLATVSDEQISLTPSPDRCSMEDSATVRWLRRR